MNLDDLMGKARAVAAEYPEIGRPIVEAVDAVQSRAHRRTSIVRAIGVLLAVLALAWWFRWDVHTIQRGDSSTAYIVDRITGRVYFMRGEDAFPMVKVPAQ